MPKDDDPPSTVSRIGDAKITDQFAREARGIVDLVGRHDSISLVVFGIAVIAAIVVGGLTGGWLMSAFFLFAVLIFYVRLTDLYIKREQQKIQRRQLELMEAEKSPQWTLPMAGRPAQRAPRGREPKEPD